MTQYDAIVIGSGFGGGAVAHALVEAGARVLMLERGDPVPRGPHNWEPDGSLDLTPFVSRETRYEVRSAAAQPRRRGLSGLVGGFFNEGGARRTIGGYHCVGGPSVFYGAVSFRLRERDFRPEPEIAGDSGAAWPFDYATLAPWYDAAETLLGVAGELGGDPTEPPRGQGFPGKLNRLSATSRRIAGAAERLGLHPFRLPLAINFGQDTGRSACVACTTCDTFACAVGAKNDVATAILEPLLQRGLELRAGHVVTRLVREGRRVATVEGVVAATGERFVCTGRQVILAAGALATPHLLLASELHQVNPAGEVVGRYLTRHCNGIAFGLFRERIDPERTFHKQLGIHDYYFGHPALPGPPGKLGGIQQVQSPPVGLIRHHLPPILGPVLGALLVPRTTGLLVMAEDQPRAHNHVTVDRSRRDRFGLPRPVIHHRHTARDEAAREALMGAAERILRSAGAVWVYRHLIDTFSHAAGTVRMGTDSRSAPLDPDCRFRGLDNLWVVDASVLPACGGVNPSLTITANALRVGRSLLAPTRDPAT